MSDRRNETAPAGIARQVSASVGGKARQWLMVGCFGFIIVVMMCVAPIWVLGWWATSGDGSSADTLQHPGQVVGTVDAPISCPSDQWVMRWSENGQTHYACTPQW